MTRLEASETRATLEAIDTGNLPRRERVREAMRMAYNAYIHIDEGAVADYIPALAQADPDCLGISMTGVTGNRLSHGDAQVEFSIQSISKAFVYALVLDHIGPLAARKAVGVNATGMAFNSVVAIEINEDRTVNPMVNAGAIATTSLLPGATGEEKWQAIETGLSRFAGRELSLDEQIYESETSHNERNRGVAHLLYGYGRLYFDPDTTTDIYTRQCSMLVTAEDLATMGATLANGGVNPVTGETVISPDTSRQVLAVLATAGLYERTGDWLFDVGLPGKSGVGGGIVTMSPGKGGLATYSPKLDVAGNSVRGQLVTRFLSNHLGLDLFASAPHEEDEDEGASPLDSAD